MDYSKLIRDPDFIRKHLKKNKDGTMSCSKDCTIVFPAKYKSRKLADLDNRARVIGIFAFIIGDRYGVFKINAMMDLLPRNVNTVMYQDKEYVELSFDAGQNVVKNVALVQMAVLIYNISDHYLSNGDIPWFFNYGDLGELFDTAIKHGGRDLLVDPAILELIAAMLARQPDDRTKYIRHAIKSAADFETGPIGLRKAGRPPIAYISLKNVELGTTNTVAKLTGNYYTDALSSALVTKTTRMEGVEEILRR